MITVTTRTLLSTKPSARCMVLATCKGGKVFGEGELEATGDEANIILAQQCYLRFNGSQLQQR